MSTLEDVMTEGSLAVRPDAAAEREQAFRRLVDRRLDASYRLAAVLVDRADAEDVTHDAVLRAWRSFDELRDHDRFDAWFHRILVNTCRDRLRRRRGKRTVSLEAAPAAVLLAPESGAAERDALRRAIEELSPDQRIVIALRFYQDLPIDEIARRLGARPGTVKSRLHHAIRYLRAAYDAGARAPREAVR